MGKSDKCDKCGKIPANIEEEPEIAQLFGARGIPYMVFISKDGDVNPNVGALSKDQLKYYFEGLLSK